MPEPKLVLKALARLEPRDHNRVMKDAVQAADSADVEDLVEQLANSPRVRGLGRLSALQLLACLGWWLMEEGIDGEG